MSQAAAKAINEGNEADIKRFKKGEVLFNEGDPGGDLYLIVGGSVKIFRQKNDVEIPLTVMGEGELIGVFTCLTRDPRTASCVAKEAVKCKVIPHEKIKKALGNLPKWFTIILKEYSVRLNEVEAKLIEQTLTMNELEKKVMTPLMDGRLFCNALNALAKIISIEVEEIVYVPIKDAIETIAGVLGADVQKIERIGKTLMDAGLLLKTVEPDKKRECFPAFACEQIIDFPAFVKRAESGPYRRLVQTQFQNKAFRIARGLATYAKQKGYKTNSENKLTVTELRNGMKNTCGVEFELEPLEPLINFRLLTVKDDPNVGEDVVIYTPSKLGRVIAHIVAYQRLAKLDYSKVKTDEEAA